MQALINHMRMRPQVYIDLKGTKMQLFVLTGVVAATAATATWFGVFKAHHDPHLVFNSREDPFPYLRARDEQQPKVSETNLEEHYDLLDILNGKYGDHYTNGVLRAAQLKRMYLRIIAFGREALDRDWSELPVPDFNALTRPSATAKVRSDVLELFSAVIVNVALNIPHLKVEIDCLLASLPQMDSEIVNFSLASMKALVVGTFPESPTLTNITISPQLDYEYEYKALRVLFEAISSEAEVLREQLLNAKFPALQSMVDILQKENQEEAMVLAKANVMAESAKGSDSTLKLIEQMRLVDPNVTCLSDVGMVLEKMWNDSRKKDELILRLQARCEETEISRDVLIEKEKILLEDKRESELEMQSLKDEQNSIFCLQSEKVIMQAELQKLSDENGQLRIRISQKEDEVMQLENGRQEYALNIQSLSDTHQSNVESLQKQLDDNIMERTNASESLAKLQTQYNLLSNTYAESTCQLYEDVAGISNTVRIHEFRLRKVKSQLSKSKSRVVILQKENLALNTHRSKLRKRLRKLWPNYHGLKKTVNQREAAVQELKAKVASSTQLNEEMEALLQANTEEILMLQSHFKETLKQLDEKKRELDNLASLNQSVSESHKELEVLRSNLSQAKEEAAENLVRGQLLLEENLCRADNLAKAKETEFHSTVAELKQQLDQATSNAEKLRIENEELTRESFELKSLSRKRDGQIAELEDELQIKMLGKEKLTRAMEMEITRIDELNRIEVNRLTEKIRELQDNAGSVEGVHASAMSQLKSDILALEQENRTLLAAMAQLSSEREQFAHNLHEAERTRAKSIQDGEKLESALVEIMAGKGNLENEMQKMLNEYTVQRELSQRLGEQFQKQSEELESCRLDLDEAQREIALQKHDLDNLAAQEAQRLSKKQMEISELQQSLLNQETHWSEQINQRNARISNLEAESSDLKTKIYSRERNWESERAELQNWLRQQEKELQKLVAYHAPHEDASCQTDFSGSTMAVVTVDLDQVDRSVVDLKDKEIAKMKMAMKEMLNSIREEHRAILTVWHNLGSRMYRDTFYQRV
ncbi:hypothetical protein PSACC_03666 [Paramicrosporidium saccamoebae]|uniref:Uncharacterized protein n=1 Tax=Paramicrosporidium saccamoebae TaxID=1246581 RepID=A0A2H9TFV9_9FUNG|nr:hypothetical protein PSACC_03666 [Paramicrosporidium saccamoebae]